MDNKQIDEKDKKNNSLIDISVRRGPALLSHDAQKLEPRKSTLSQSNDPVVPSDSSKSTETTDQSSVGEMNELVKMMDEKKKAEEQLKAEAEKLEKIEQLIVEKKYFIETHANKNSLFVKALAVFVLLGLVGVGAYLFLQKADNNTAKQNTSSNVTSNNISNSTTNTATNTESSNLFTVKTNSVADFSIYKLNGWTYDATIDEDTGSFLLSINTDKNKQVRAYNYVGKGGDCIPGSGDSPHNISNMCPTYEELSYAKTNTGYLVKVKYTGHVNNSETGSSMGVKTTYWYCLRSSTYLEKDFKINQPDMGAYLACGPDDLVVDFGSDIDNTSLAFFDNSEVKEAAAGLINSSFTLKHN